MLGVLPRRNHPKANSIVIIRINQSRTIITVYSWCHYKVSVETPERSEMNKFRLQVADGMRLSPWKDFVRNFTNVIILTIIQDGLEDVEWGVGRRRNGTYVEMETEVELGEGGYNGGSAWLGGGIGRGGVEIVGGGVSRWKKRWRRWWWREWHSGRRRKMWRTRLRWKKRSRKKWRRKRMEKVEMEKRWRLKWKNRWSWSNVSD